MDIHDFRGSSQHALMHGHVSLSPNFAIEAGIYDLGGVYALTVKWHPRIPNDAEFNELAPQFEEAIAPYNEMALRLVKLQDGGDE